jgi:hypothetical protein
MQSVAEKQPFHRKENDFYAEISYFFNLRRASYQSTYLIERVTIFLYTKLFKARVTGSVTVEQTEEENIAYLSYVIIVR